MNLQTVTDATGAVTPVQLSYDPLNRIAGVAGGGLVGGGGGVSETYSIDAWGNLQRAGNFNLSAAYTTANQLPASDGYAYDTAGDLISDGNGNSFAYDTDGHLILSNGTDAYNYGADGHMVYSVTAAGETDNIYLGDLLVGKYQPGSASWTDMIYGGGNLVATVGGTQTAVPDYRLTDHLGSLAVLTDGSGNVLESNVFVPYGEQLSGNTLDPFQYTGLEREPDTGTDRALFRQYDSSQDRWLTPDLYHGSYDMNDPQSFNRYAYVRNSPTFYTDPSGLNEGGCLICIIGIDIGVEVGAILGLDELFGIGGPSFHGSMQPRPGTNGPGSFGGPLGVLTDGANQASYTFSVYAYGTSPSAVQGAYIFSVFASAPVLAAAASAANNGPQQPRQPQHFWQKPGCSSALGELGIGLAGTAITGGAFVGSYFLGPEIYEGLEGLMTISHLAPVGAPGLILTVQGAAGAKQNCF